MFVGYALKPREVAAYGVRQLLAWAVIGRLALGSDGRVYVHEGEIGGHGVRKAFRGVAMTSTERAALVEELHRTAFNLTLRVQSKAGQRKST
ncbi:hypothetical protein [Polyangium sp. 15x6]|uniref:hypothetical protein n=1 Tax=Polyangium sp. 15x6 TaxID=3042687 RepID=UPI00249B79F3|nr:hypothetical protein [Polyangium sp. 15x6]MDI3287353.1 hypothetical protein [Polyangium sp. 15x6]